MPGQVTLVSLFLHEPQFPLLHLIACRTVDRLDTWVLSVLNVWFPPLNWASGILEAFTG
jgi:hypothetical protein